MKPKLLILHDSPDFGGHERMLIKLLPGVLDTSGFETVFCMPESNHRLAERLDAELPKLRVIRWPFAKRRGEPYLRRFRWWYRAGVRRLVAAEQPNLVLLAQGRIENLAVPMSALPAGSRLVSYIPMAHRLDEMQRSGVIGDRLRRPLYQRPNRFIVPSEAVAAQVRRAGGTAPISVVENVIEPLPPVPKSYARVLLDLPPDRKIGLFLGRLDPQQKGLDRLLAAMERAGPAALADWTFLFVGDGPGAFEIERTARASGLDLHILPWTERADLYLSSADLLLLPSRWEGLPLVMLEAMHHGLPILASDIDVYRCHLSDASLTDFATVDLPAALAKATAPEAVERFARHSAAKLDATTIEGSRERFADALFESLVA